MALKKTEALVLRSTRFGETSKILTLYSRSSGKLSVIAKGARNTRSRFGGALEPPNFISIVYYDKESRELQTLSQADIVEPFHRIKADLQRTVLALAICELINRLETAGEQNPLFFRLNLSALRALDTTSGDSMQVFRAYQLHLATVSGFQANFTTCLSCGRVPEGPVGFDFARGAFHCADCAGAGGESMTLSHDSLTYLHRLQRVHINEVHALKSGKVVDAQADHFLAAYLRYHLDDLRSLNTSRLLRELELSLPGEPASSEA